MERLVYKGFESTPKHDAERGVFYGLVDGIDGLCEYESETAEGVEKAFRDAVDDYIDACRESSQRKEEVRVKDTCPYCEAGMIETDEAFSLEGPNGPITITGVHHNKCPECGEITFGPRHLTEMHEFKLSHRSMFP